MKYKKLFESAEDLAHEVLTHHGFNAEKQHGRTVYHLTVGALNNRDIDKQYEVIDDLRAIGYSRKSPGLGLADVFVHHDAPKKELAFARTLGRLVVYHRDSTATRRSES